MNEPGRQPSDSERAHGEDELRWTSFFYFFYLSSNRNVVEKRDAAAFYTWRSKRLLVKGVTHLPPCTLPVQSHWFRCRIEIFFCDQWISLSVAYTTDSTCFNEQSMGITGKYSARISSRHFGISALIGGKWFRWLCAALIQRRMDFIEVKNI